MSGTSFTLFWPRIVASCTDVYAVLPIASTPTLYASAFAYRWQLTEQRVQSSPHCAAQFMQLSSDVPDGLHR